MAVGPTGQPARILPSEQPAVQSLGFPMVHPGQRVSLRPPASQSTLKKEQQIGTRLKVCPWSISNQT